MSAPTALRFFPRLALAALLAMPLLARAQTPNFLTAQEQAAGWTLLFDGKTATGLRGLQKPDFLKAGWKIEEGALVLTKTIEQSGKPTGGDLTVPQQLADFEFRWEWKLGVSGDSGVLYNARANLGQKPAGCEFQIIDDVHHPDGLKGGPIKRTGALYGILEPGANKQINATGWNEGRLRVEGNHVEHWVNGAKVLEYEFGSPALVQAARASGMKLPPTFGTKVRSPLVLLDQGEEVAFRSLKLRVLSPPVGGVATPVPAGTPAPPRVGPTPFKSRIPSR